jgi:geranylgeranyl diphosphate synthase, type I
MKRGNPGMFLNALRAVKKEVDGRLETFLEEKSREASRVSPSAGEMTGILKAFTLRSGKRFRAALSLHGFRCLSEREDEAVWNIAMCMELIQTFLLIHDDIIDEDATRRGGPTVHCEYEAIHRERFSRRDPAHFGASMAIMCGDLAGTLAFEVLNRARMEPPVREAVFASMTRMLFRVIHGESMDVLSEAEENVTEEKMRQIYELKVSAYTIEGPLHMGGLLAGAGTEDLDRMTRYAVPLGQAFQVQDDILGLFGNEKKTGKPVGSDIKAGKRTFLILKALDRASPEERAFLRRKLGDRELGREELERVRGIVRRTGALDDAAALARGLSADALDALQGCAWREEGRRFLEGAVAFVRDREY